MSTTSYDSVFTLGSTRIIVPVGATAAVFIQPYAGQLSAVLKFSSGGTCEILPTGLTQTSIGVFSPIAQNGNTLLALSGSGYCFSASEVLTINGPAAFYLSSTGATTIIHAVFGKGQGF